VERLISEKFPNLRVVPSNYPPHPSKAMLAKVVTTVQFGMIGLALGGDKILPLINVPTHYPTYQSIKENKLMVCAGAWMVGNMISQNLLSTGAFEVSYQGKVIFSKLEKNRLPSVDEIISGIQKHKPKTIHRKKSDYQEDF